jgi:hypothetical protein
VLTPPEGVQVRLDVARASLLPCRRSWPFCIGSNPNNFPVPLLVVQTCNNGAHQ